MVWTQTNSFTVANTALAWDGWTGNNVWDTLSLNWHPHLQPGSGSDLFRQGDRAVFPLAGTFTLATDMDAEQVDIAQHLTLAGGRDLWLLRSLNVAENWDATLGVPRLTGSGRVAVSNATLRVGNPANDFTGGVLVTRGTLHADVSAPASSVLGAGDVTLGQETPALSTAVLNFTNTAGVPV